METFSGLTGQSYISDIKPIFVGHVTSVKIEGISHQNSENWRAVIQGNPEGLKCASQR